jgi:hypothetical protein
MDIAGKIHFDYHRLRNRPSSELNIQIRHIQRILLNELPSWLDLLAHQPREQLVGVGGFIVFDLQERAGGGVERGFPELRGVHFAEAFVALQGEAFAASVEHGFEERDGAGDALAGVAAFEDGGGGEDVAEFLRGAVDGAGVG